MSLSIWEKKYRVGLIGVGSIAHIAHLPILAARTDVEMVGAFAEHIESVQRTQKSYAIQSSRAITWTSCWTWAWTAPLSCPQNGPRPAGGPPAGGRGGRLL